MRESPQGGDGGHHRLVENSPVPILVVDTDYRIREANEAWREAVEADTVQSLLESSALQFIPEEAQPASKNRLDQALHNDNAVEAREYRFLTVDDNRRYARGSVIPTIVDSGESGALVMLENITTQRTREREIERRHNQIERLYEISVELAGCDSPEAVYDVMIEALEDILDLNMCAVDRVENNKLWLAATSSDLPDDGYSDPPVDLEEAGLAGKAYHKKQSILVDDVTEHPDAEPDGEYSSVLTVPMEDVGVVQAASFDRAAFDQTDMELVELLSGHAREVVQRLNNEQELQKRQKELDLLRQVFSRVFRHNMRNELSLINGHAEIIANNNESESTDSTAESILEASKRLLSHCGKARQVERVMSEEREIQSDSLQRMVSAAVSEVESKFPSETIAVSVDDVDVSAVIGIEQAIENALENALKHNSSPVVVRVTSKIQEDCASIVVKDNGEGIPEEELGVINNEEETSLSHGSGVGLWLMKWVVEKSQGAIRLTNTSEGARVEMTLPKK
ncbi:sensor histidine kinase [Halorubellus salinus]|uniref:sensor histidine kinase n=1 Tax=Halorubellus salinus TaxID=755309 RepID=UPI001D0617DF|nr:ATP-binding protein [Halorubellus salinus]